MKRNDYTDMTIDQIVEMKAKGYSGQIAKYGRSFGIGSKKDFFKATVSLMAEKETGLDNAEKVSKAIKRFFNSPSYSTKVEKGQNIINLKYHELASSFGRTNEELRKKGIYQINQKNITYMGRGHLDGNEAEIYKISRNGVTVYGLTVKEGSKSVIKYFLTKEEFQNQYGMDPDQIGHNFNM